MIGSHVGHDCQVGSNVIIANNTMLGGHCHIGDHVFLGGHCAVHQHVRIGESAMVAGYSAFADDVIPFGFVLQPVARLAGINVVGMRRRGVSKDAIRAVQQAYSLLFEGEGEFASRVDAGRRRIGQRARGREDHRVHPREAPAAHHDEQGSRRRDGDSE